MNTSKTYMAKKGEIAQDWYVVDGKDAVLGRMAVKIAKLLIGKHKPEYTPHVDVGDCVIVVNAGKIRLTGNKMKDKIYYFHSGYMGGLKERPFNWMMQKYPERVIRLAVKRMLPKNRLGSAMLNKLKIYEGTNHPHSAQQPEAMVV